MPANKVGTTTGTADAEYKGEPLDPTLSNGPMEKRSCTDPLCCLLFLAFLVGMVVIGAYGLSKGNPNLVGRGYDADGMMCGFDTGYEDYNYLYFPTPRSGYLTQTVCVKECPTAIGQVECKTNSVYTTTTACKNDDSEATQGANLATGDQTGKFYAYPTTTFVSRFCLPSVVSEAAGEYWTTASDTVLDSDLLEQWISDIKTTWPVIAVSMLGAFVLGFIYMLLMRYCSGVMTWGAILAYIVGLAILGWRFYDYGVDKEEAEAAVATDSSTSDTSSSGYNAQKIIGYVLWGITGFSILAILCLFSRIRLAIAILKAAADYVKDTWSVFLVPPITVLILACFYVWWGITSIYLVSSGDPTQLSDYPFGTFEFDTQLKRLLIYQLFGLLWINAFIIAACQFIIASSACLWYFAQGTGQGAKGTVRKSTWRLFRYHFGSIAFGSLILAIIQMIRLILAYFQVQAKKLAGKEGKMVRFVLACLQCYVACFERFIKFLNKNAYIQIALTGKNFCVSAKNAFFLILRNPLRFGVVNGIGVIFILFGKIFVAAITALISFIVITKWDKYSEDIYSPFFPTLTIFIFAYGIGAIFMTIYGLAADAILACFVVDEELSKDKNAPSRHCPESLRSFIAKNKKN